MIDEKYKYDFYERPEFRGRLILAPVHELKAKNPEYKRSFPHLNNERLIIMYQSGWLTGDAKEFVEKELLHLNEENLILL